MNAIDIVDIVMLSSIIISIVIFCFIIIPRRTKKQYDSGISTIARKLRNSWLRYSLICIFMYFWCILFSILCTLLVLHISCFSTDFGPSVRARIIIYSIISIFTTICPYIVDLKALSKAYREAFRQLDTALLKNTSLEDAIEKGEELINEKF